MWHNNIDFIFFGTFGWAIEELRKGSNNKKRIFAISDRFLRMGFNKN